MGQGHGLIPEFRFVINAILLYIQNTFNLGGMYLKVGLGIGDGPLKHPGFGPLENF